MPDLVSVSVSHFLSVLIRKSLIISKRKPTGDTEGRLWHSQLILFYQTTGEEEVLCLSCQAWLFFGWESVGAGCPGDKRLPGYLCVKGHTGLTEEAKATTISVFHKLGQLSKAWSEHTQHHIIHSHLHMRAIP